MMMMLMVCGGAVVVWWCRGGVVVAVTVVVVVVVMVVVVMVVVMMVTVVAVGHCVTAPAPWPAVVAAPCLLQRGRVRGASCKHHSLHGKSWCTGRDLTHTRAWWLRRATTWLGNGTPLNRPVDIARELGAIA
jgi:hypothetical protein